MRENTDTPHIPPLPESSGSIVTPIAASEVLPQVEGYQVISRLGEGGMGTVWRAWQLSTRREVALKLMGLALFGSDRATRRFDREVSLASRFHHPNIARVYHSGIHQGIYFYAMELVNGVPLDEYVTAKCLCETNILGLMVLICAAVQHAHENGIIHRDLKPSNILVDKEGVPHVLDFGLAKASDPVEDTTPITREGDLAGTPAFMSPEQAAGEVDLVDRRTDVYSLGVILYRLLTGKTPHDLSGSAVDLLHRIREQEIIPPHRAKPGLNADLVAVLIRALWKTPDGRYTSAGDMANDIGRYLRCEPVIARAPTLFYVLHKKVRKYRLPLVVAFVIAATFLFLVGLTYVNQRHAELREAYGELKGMDHLSTASMGRGEAVNRIWKAYDLLKARGEPDLPARIALVDCYQFDPDPVTKIASANVGALATTFRSDSKTAVVLNGADRWTTIDLATGLTTLRGHQSPLSPGSTPSVARGTQFGAISEGGRFAICGSVSEDVSGRTITLIEWRDLSDDKTASKKCSVDGRVIKATVSADGRWVAYLLMAPVSQQRPVSVPKNEVNHFDTVWIYDVRSGTVRQLVDGNANDAELAFGADDRLMCGDCLGNVRLWYVSQNLPSKLTWTMPLRVARVGFASSGKLVWASDCEGRAKWWDATDGRQLGTFDPKTSSISYSILSCDGRLVLSLTSGGAIRVHASFGGRLIRLFKHTSPVTHVYCSPDNLVTLCRSADGSLCVWNLGAPGKGMDEWNTTGRQELEGARSLLNSGGAAMQVMCGALTTDGSGALFGDTLGHVAWFDRKQGKSGILTGHRSPVRGVAFAGGSADVFSADSQGVLMLRSRAENKAKSVETHVQPWDVDWNAKRSLAVIGGIDILQVIDMGKGSPIYSQRLMGKTARLVRFSPAGESVLYCDLNGRATMLDISGGGVRWQFPSESEVGANPIPIRAATVAGDGTRVLLGDEKGTVTLLNAATGDVIARHNVQDGAVTALAFCTDRRTCLVGRETGELMVMRVDEWEQVGNYSHPGGAIRFIVSSEESILTAAVALEGPVLWDLEMPRKYRAIAQSAETARQRLLLQPTDRKALKTLEDWYAFHGLSKWANLAAPNSR